MSQRAGQYSSIPMRNSEENDNNNSDARRRRPQPTPTRGSSSGAAPSRGSTSDAVPSRGSPYSALSASSRGSTPSSMTGSRTDGSYRSFYAWEDRRGMTITSGSVVLKKDAKNLVGISIGGGAPYCPCLYVVQVCLMPLLLSVPICGVGMSDACLTVRAFMLCSYVIFMSYCSCLYVVQVFQMQRGKIFSCVNWVQ